MGPTHRNRHTHLCQIVVQLGLYSYLLAAISWLCCFLAAQFCGRYQLHGMSDRINTREQACTYIPLCFAALIVQLQLRLS
jgi:hypothetical protein